MAVSASAPPPLWNSPLRILTNVVERRRVGTSAAANPWQGRSHPLANPTFADNMNIAFAIGIFFLVLALFSQWRRGGIKRRPGEAGLRLSKTVAGW